MTVHSSSYKLKGIEIGIEQKAFSFIDTLSTNSQVRTSSTKFINNDLINHSPSINQHIDIITKELKELFSQPSIEMIQSLIDEKNMTNNIKNNNIRIYTRLATKTLEIFPMLYSIPISKLLISDFINRLLLSHTWNAAVR